MSNGRFVRAKLEALDEFNTTKAELDMMLLLRDIKKLAHKNYKIKYPNMVVYKASKVLYTLKQGFKNNMSTHL